MRSINKNRRQTEMFRPYFLSLFFFSFFLSSWFYCLSLFIHNPWFPPHPSPSCLAHNARQTVRKQLPDLYIINLYLKINSNSYRQRDINVISFWTLIKHLQMSFRFCCLRLFCGYQRGGHYNIGREFNRELSLGWNPEFLWLEIKTNDQMSFVMPN